MRSSDIDDVGTVICSQSDADSESRNRFRIGASLNIFCTMPLPDLTFERQLPRSPLGIDQLI